MRRLLAFRDGVDISLRAIDAQLIDAFESHLHRHGLSPNTCSFYLRTLRALYNRAVDLGHTRDSRPFRHAYTGNAQTPKRALKADALRRLASADLSDAPSLAFARDAFLMSFYLYGMSFVDMCQLKRSDLRAGYVTYRRRKTGRLMRIAWLPELDTLASRYPRAPGCLLPLLPADGGTSYLSVLWRVNRNLRLLGRRLGIDTTLTTYVARHSWATAARDTGESIEAISKCLGHRDTRTTEIYLGALDTSIIDRLGHTVAATISTP